MSDHGPWCEHGVQEGRFCSYCERKGEQAAADEARAHESALLREETAARILVALMEQTAHLVDTPELRRRLVTTAVDAADELRAALVEKPERHS